MSYNRVAESALEAIKEWVVGNLDPDDIFEDSVLIQHVQKCANPSEVFTEEELREWALNNMDRGDFPE